MSARAITGTTRVAAVIGWPVAHSRSPAMMNAAFAHAGVDAVLVPIAARPDDLAAVIGGLRAMRALGASVTLPHKLAVAALCDELTPDATAIGAVNCVRVTDAGAVIGDNTDAGGFTDALAAAGFAIAGARCCLLGAGGAARAVAHGLVAAGAAAIEVVSRSPSPWVVHAPWSEAVMSDAFARADLVVDCTPIALNPEREPACVDAIPIAALLPTAWVSSLVYHRVPQLLTRAAAAGHRTLDGADMLVYQGARAFTWWTGVAAPIDVMRAALHMKLS